MKKNNESLKRNTFKTEQLITIFNFSGKMDMPALYPKNINLNDTFFFTRFNESFGYEFLQSARNSILHFYVDDYQFERCWSKPADYINHLKKFKYVISPDFSLYVDLPVAHQIWNCYRNRLLAAYWQAKGVKIIPNVSWSDKKSFEWCFDGIPQNSTVAISTVGTRASKEAFLKGYYKMLEVLKPTQIIVYGKIYPEMHQKNLFNYEPGRKLWEEEEP